MVKKIEKFGADWHKYSTDISIILTELCKKYPDIEYIEYNDDSEEFKNRNIKMIPKLYFYNEDGIEIHHLSGIFPLCKLSKIIEYHNKERESYNPYEMCNEVSAV